YDLGRPTRFLNMLRVVRPTSPMSVGSWVLAGSGACNLAALTLWNRGGRLGRLGEVADWGAAALGLPLAGYTAVLLSNSAVPLWQAVRRSLPLLFVASAATSAAAALGGLPFRLRAEERRVVRWFGAAAQVAGLCAMIAVERDAARVPAVARPLRRGKGGALWRAAQFLGGA